MAALITAAAVKVYLDEQTQLASLSSFHFPLPAVEDVVAVKGGTTNFIYRLFFKYPHVINTPEGSWIYHTAILKHATDYVASDPVTHFSVQRQYFEAEALQRIPNKLTTPPELVQLPKLFHFDSKTALLAIEDVCPPTLGSPQEHSEYTQLSIQEWWSNNSSSLKRQSGVAEELGQRLGTFLANLHSLGQTREGHSSPVEPNAQNDLRAVFDKNIAARDLTVETTFGEALARLSQYGVELGPEQRLSVQETMENMIREASSVQVTLIMGDFWAGNILLTLRPDTEAGDALKAIHLIDWEFATYAPAFCDLAHFAAEAWLNDRFQSNHLARSSLFQQITSAMFRAYRKAGAIIDMARVIYYIAGHICYFLSFTKWKKDLDLRRSVALEAVQMIESVRRGDWAQLQESMFIGSLWNS